MKNFRLLTNFSKIHFIFKETRNGAEMIIRIKQDCNMEIRRIFRE